MEDFMQSIISDSSDQILERKNAMLIKWLENAGFFFTIEQILQRCTVIKDLDNVFRLYVDSSKESKTLVTKWVEKIVTDFDYKNLKFTITTHFIQIIGK